MSRPAFFLMLMMSMQVTFGAHASTVAPTALAQYRLDKESWSATTEVIDERALHHGTMVGTVNNEANAQVCSGALIGNNTSTVIDGINTRVDVNDLGGAGSIAFWFKSTTVWNSGGTRKIFDGSRNATGNEADDYDFYVQREPDGGIKMVWEDSAGERFTLQEVVTRARLKEVWYHITVTFNYGSGEFEIYVDGEVVASTRVAGSGVAPDLSHILLGDRNDLLGFAGTGGSNSKNAANGAFDEINIYDSVLSVAEIRGLMAVARDCPTPLLPRACLGSFPNAVNAIKDRIISFGENAQILANPDNTLSARVINKTPSSHLLTCDTSDCVVGDAEVKNVRPGHFRKTNTKDDVTVRFAGSQTIGTGSHEFDEVKVRSLGTLNFDSSLHDEFLIDKLDVNFAATVNFAAGSYWINELELSSRAKLMVLDGGPVRLYVNKVSGWSSAVLINSPRAGLSGDSSQFLMYFYSEVEMASQTTFSGSLFSIQNLDLHEDGHFYGLITGKNVTLGENTKVHYDENAYLGMTDITWCDSGSAVLGSIVVEAPATAVNCQPAEVSIKIMDNNGALSADYAGTISLRVGSGHGDWRAATGAAGVLSRGDADDGVASYEMVAADLGEATFYLSNTHPETTTVTVSAENTTQSADIIFQAAGFVFSTVATQVAGKQSTAITLQALQTDLLSGACAPLLADEQVLEMALECVAPTDCGAAIFHIDATPVTSNVAGAVSSYDDVSLNFGNSTDHDANFTLHYDDAGSLRIWAKYQLPLASGAGSGNYIFGGSNNFTLVPGGFCIEPSAANWQCSVPGLTADCSAFKQAGDNFNLVVSAKNYAANDDDCGAATTHNFAGEVDLSHRLISPTPLSGGDPGVFSVGSASLVNGTASLAANFSDMGAYSLTAGGNDYLGVSLPSNDSATIGRFYPRDFFIQASTAAIYSDASGSFSYSGQRRSNGDGAIGYAVPPSFNYQPRGFSAQPLKNYLPPLAGTPSVSATTSSSQVGQQGTNLNVASGFFAGTVTGPNASYEFTYTFSNTDHFVFSRDSNSLVAPFNNDTDINISDFSEAIDSITLANGPLVIAGSGGEIRYGRLSLQNAYGPETAAVSQSWQVQYFDGTNFKVNTLDNTTRFNLADIGTITVTDVGDHANPLRNTDSSASTSVGATGNFNAGLLTVDWSAPLNGHYGNYWLPLTVESWLQYDWFGNGDENPQGNVTFGQYRGHDKIIYWKEINY